MTDAEKYKSEKLEWSYHPNAMEDEEYLTFLLCKGELFINNGHWNKDWPKDKITIHLGCNDIFAWGCADAEDISYSDLPEIYEHYIKDPLCGTAVWCIKKRGVMPQKPVYDKIKASGIWNLDEMCLEKNSGW